MAVDRKLKWLGEEGDQKGDKTRQAIQKHQHCLDKYTGSAMMTAELALHDLLIDEAAKAST